MFTSLLLILGLFFKSFIVSNNFTLSNSVQPKMRSSLVVAALFGLSGAIPANLVAREPEPMCATVTVYIDDWNSATVGPMPNGGANQNNGEPARLPTPSVAHTCSRAAL